MLDPFTYVSLQFSIKKSTFVYLVIHLVIFYYLQGVWGFLLAVIAFTALLSVWFAVKAKTNTHSGRAKKMSTSVLARLAIDETIQKGIVSEDQ